MTSPTVVNVSEVFTPRRVSADNRWVCLTSRLGRQQTDKQTGRQITDRHIGIQSGRHKQIGRQAVNQTDRQTGKQT